MQIFLLCAFSGILTHLLGKSNLLGYWKENLHVQGQADDTQEKYLHTSGPCKTLSKLLPSRTGRGKKLLWNSIMSTFFIFHYAGQKFKVTDSIICFPSHSSLFQLGKLLSSPSFKSRACTRAAILLNGVWSSTALGKSLGQLFQKHLGHWSAVQYIDRHLIDSTSLRSSTEKNHTLRPIV